MKMNVLVAVALLGAGNAAHAAADEQPLSVAVTGQGASDVWCHITPKSGEEFVRYFRAGTPFASTNVRRATCSFKNSTATPMTITLGGDAWACPFPVSAAGACTKEVEARGNGDFDLKRKRV